MGDARGPGPETGPTPGQRLGRYTVLERLGTGCMGAVYADHDPDLDRPVALMVLRAGPGVGLGRWLAAAPERSWSEVLAVFTRAARGLDAAHAAGPVHGDALRPLAECADALLHRTGPPSRLAEAALGRDGYRADPDLRPRLETALGSIDPDGARLRFAGARELLAAGRDRALSLDLAARARRALEALHRRRQRDEAARWVARVDVRASVRP